MPMLTDLLLTLFAASQHHHREALTFQAVLKSRSAWMHSLILIPHSGRCYISQ